MPRKAEHLELTPEQYNTLKMWGNGGKTEQRIAQRAKVILLSARGKSLKEISREIHLSYQNCQKWRARFKEKGIEGLKDEKRKGRPAIISPEKRVSVITLACSPPLQGNTSWSCRKLARATGLGVSTVNRILNEGSLKPHKVKYWCGRSSDPEFEKKQMAIIRLRMR